VDLGMSPLCETSIRPGQLPQKLISERFLFS